jgi:Ni/Co efflux regulator RcnB
MTYNKQNTHNNEWNSNHHYDSEAPANRKMVPIVIQQKNNWAKGKTYNRKDNAADQFPFPGNYKKG